MCIYSNDPEVRKRVMKSREKFWRQLETLYQENPGLNGMQLLDLYEERYRNVGKTANETTLVAKT